MEQYKNNSIIEEVAWVKDFGIKIFGSKEKFDNWLNSESPALGGIRPLELLQNADGILLVKDELIRIEQGVLA